MFSGMEYVYEVYKERSFSKAAKNLYISQPSLSATVKRIEKTVGSPIFDRSTAPITLTECGEKYIEAVEQIQSIQGDFKNYMNDMQQLMAGSLRIGGSNLFSSYVLPPLLTEFKKRFPKIAIHLLEESTAQLEKSLLEGKLDFIIDNYFFSERIFSRNLYHREHLLLAVPRHLEINQALTDYQISIRQIITGSYLEENISPVPLEKFRDEYFLFLKTENDTRERGIKLCQNSGFKPRILLNLDQQVTAYNITCSGMGISFISDTLVKCVLPHPEVVYYKLQGEETSRNIYFYRKKGRYVTRVMQEFLKIAEEIPIHAHAGQLFCAGL